MKSVYINSDQLQKMDTRYRAHLINSLGGFKSVAMIGTLNKNDQTNLAVFNSIVHLGANPALIGFVLRPDSVDRHTWNNIEQTTYYTINHINQDIYKQAHQTSAKYPDNISEFEQVGLTAEYKAGFTAPFVQESHIQLGVKFEQRIPIELNGTSLVIGSITELYFPSECLNADGFVDISKAFTMAGSGLDGYFNTHKISRLSYARPGVAVDEID